MSTATNALLGSFLQVSVSLRILSLLEQGGPNDDDLAHAQKSSDFLGEHGDALFYRQPGKSADAANSTAQIIAILSFAPGGVDAFGLHFEAEKFKVTRKQADD